MTGGTALKRLLSQGDISLRCGRSRRRHKDQGGDHNGGENFCHACSSRIQAFEALKGRWSCARQRRCWQAALKTLDPRRASSSPDMASHWRRRLVGDVTSPQHRALGGTICMMLEMRFINARQPTIVDEGCPPCFAPAGLNPLDACRSMQSVKLKLPSERFCRHRLQRGSSPI